MNKAHSLFRSPFPKQPAGAISKAPLTGQRVLKFKKTVPGRNHHGKNTVKFVFKDTKTGREVARTVNDFFSGKSFLYMFLCRLIPNGSFVLKQSGANSDLIQEHITKQVGKLYIAECEPDRTGTYTNIVDLRIKE